MPHQCVRCSALYGDTAQEIIKGCSCGARMFFFIRKEKMERLKNAAPLEALQQEQRIAIEKDVRDLIGEQDDEDPVILDIEAIRITKPGAYEIDLVHLFKNDPLVIRLEEGKYMIDIAGSFDRIRNKEQ